MKMVITVPWGERLGGAENMLWTFLRTLDRAQVDPAVVFFSHGGFEREVASLQIPTFVVEAGRLRNLPRFIQVITLLADLLRKQRPDLLLNWSAKTQIYGASAAIFAGIWDRVVWWQHGIPDTHWLDRLATVLPARAVGCSSERSAEAQRRLAPRRRTFVVRPGIEEASLPAEKDSYLLRQRLGIPAHRKVFGIVGRLQPWKGQDRFIRALAGLRERGHDVHGLIVGGDAYNLSPAYERHLLRLVHDLSLTDYITFTGQVKDSHIYTAIMDVLVNASMEEPFGIVLLEAMAIGVPVVAFNAAGPAEIVESEVSGLLVPAGEEALLTEALERLAISDELRHRLGNRGRERFHASFTALRMTEQLQQTLEELCEATAGHLRRSESFDA